VDRRERWKRSIPWSPRRRTATFARSRLKGRLANAPSIRPSPGQSLVGAGADAGVNAPIETFGEGARGFNVYNRTVKLAKFDRVTTHAGGAIGIQFTQPIGRLVVHRGIETFGGEGVSRWSRENT
jgi:hypothetical protein